MAYVKRLMEEEKNKSISRMKKKKKPKSALILEKDKIAHVQMGQVGFGPNLHNKSTWHFHV